MIKISEEEKIVEDLHKLESMQLIVQIIMVIVCIIVAFIVLYYCCKIVQILLSISSYFENIPNITNNRLIGRSD